MIDYAKRLGKCSARDIPFEERLQMQAKCYLAALNLFRQIGSDFCWSEESFQTRDVEFPPASPKRMRDGEDGYLDVTSLPKPAPREFYTLKDLKRRYVVTNSQLILVKRGVLRSAQILSETDTLSLLVDGNEFEKAILLAKLCDNDTECFGLTLVFRKMADNAISLYDE
jgi:hypothetical protein